MPGTPRLTNKSKAFNYQHVSSSGFLGSIYFTWLHLYILLAEVFLGSIYFNSSIYIYILLAEVFLGSIYFTQLHLYILLAEVFLGSIYFTQLHLYILLAEVFLGSIYFTQFHLYIYYQLKCSLVHILYIAPSIYITSRALNFMKS